MSLDLLDNPAPWTEVVKHLASKALLPTSLSSAQIKKSLPAQIRRQSFFSATNTLLPVLEEIKTQVGSIVNPQTIQRPDRITPENPQGNVTVGANPATARAAIKDMLDAHGYTPEKGTEGTIKDLSSARRIDFTVKTNEQLAHGAGQFIQGNDPDVVEAFPAWELYRQEKRRVVRGEKVVHGEIEEDEENSWPARFSAAADAAGDDDAARVLEETGRMIARKDSPLWEQLGEGAGGFDDTLDNPYPPFAFNSGMWTREVSRGECVKLGLIEEGDKVEPADFDLQSLFGTGAQDAAAAALDTALGSAAKGIAASYIAA